MPLHQILQTIFLFREFSIELNCKNGKQQTRVWDWKCHCFGPSEIKIENEWMEKTTGDPSRNQCIHKKDITTLNLYATVSIFIFKCIQSAQSDLSLSSSTWLVWSYWRLFEQQQRGLNLFTFAKGNFGPFLVSSGISFSSHKCIYSFQYVVPLNSARATVYLLLCTALYSCWSVKNLTLLSVNLFKILKYLFAHCWTMRWW